MRIGVVGKGGSGKTSVSWMLLQTAHKAGLNPVGLDADYNQHLAAMLGTNNEAVKPLGPHKAALVTHVMGVRDDVSVASFKKATKPVAQSRLISLDAPDAFLQPYIHNANDISLVRVGEYGAEDIGQRCYHAQTSVVDILLHHLKPSPRPLIIDYTAGVDPFASDIADLLDAVVLVIEPTLKGVAVARQWQELLQGKLPLHLIANKIAGDDDLNWLAETLAPLALLASLSADPHIKAIERGVAGSWTQLLPANQANLLNLWQQLQQASAKARAA